MTDRPGHASGSRQRRYLGVLLAVVCITPGARAAPAADAAESIEQGRYLVQAGGCLTCHTANTPDAIPLAGGGALRTAFGTFYAPNLTPDRATGVGGWTDADLGRALREGVAPDGSNYYPVFPYPAYSGLRDADVAAIGAYLRSLKPVRQAAPEHELPWYLSSRLVMPGWNLINFAAGRFEPDAGHDASWNRGAYLVRHLGHCGECHSPRNLLGGIDHSRELAGNPAGPEGKKVPDITDNQTTGIGHWSVGDIEFFLETGVLPDGDFAGSSMSAVIKDNTSKLTPADRRAIAAYLKALEPAGASR